MVEGLIRYEVLFIGQRRLKQDYHAYTGYWSGSAVPMESRSNFGNVSYLVSLLKNIYKKKGSYQKKRDTYIW